MDRASLIPKSKSSKNCSAVIAIKRGPWTAASSSSWRRAARFFGSSTPPPQLS
jgi:hypothetical protein